MPGGRPRSDLEFVHHQNRKFLDALQPLIVSEKGAAARSKSCRDLEGICQAEIVFHAQLSSIAGDGRIERNKGHVGALHKNIGKILLRLDQTQPHGHDQAFRQGNGRGGSLKQAGINALEDVVGNCDVGGIAFDEVDHGRRVQEQAGDALKGDADFT